jgi:hypothetical protein
MRGLGKIPELNMGKMFLPLSCLVLAGIVRRCHGFNHAPKRNY